MEYTFTFELQRTDNGELIDTISHTHYEKQDETWMEILEEFRRFLSGCGYIIPLGEIEIRELGGNDG